jgi:hypothetical protein
MSPGCLASTRITLVNWLSIRGSLQLVSDLIKLFQCIAIIGKEGPLRIVEAIPLYCPHYGKWRHMPPRDLERTPCRHPCWAENLLVEVYHNRRESQNGSGSILATLT